MSLILQSVLVAAAGTGVSTKDSQTRPKPATDKDAEDTRSKQTKRIKAEDTSNKSVRTMGTTDE